MRGFFLTLVTSTSLLTSSSVLFAQAQVDPPLTDDGTTPFSESFTTGDVAPVPPPEGEPDTSGIDGAELAPNTTFEDDSDYGMNDRFLMGVTGALAFPHVINVGLETLTYKKYGVSLNYGNISRNVSGVDVAMKHSDIRFRFHPWTGSFFGGVAFGQHTLTGEKVKDIDLSTSVKVPTTVKVTASANYVAPHIGWFAIWEPGFTMGFDLGWMFPLNTDSKTEVSFANLPAGAEPTVRETAEFKKAVSDVNDAAEGYAKKSLPFVSMIRIGWMF